MKGRWIFQLILVLACLVGSLSVQATNSTAIEYTYFDASGNVIGNQYRDCYDMAQHAGTLDSSYSVIQTWVCPGVTTCTYNAISDKWVCSGTIGNTQYKNVAYVSLPGGITPQQFCADQVPGNIYDDTVGCTESQPLEIVGIGLVYSSGFN